MIGAEIEYLSNKASEAEIADHLSHCDADFVPPLNGRVGIPDYARKIVCNAARFEAWSGCSLVGLVAAYCNDQDKRIAYITNVSVRKVWTGKGIAASLINQCIEYAKASGMQLLSLNVASANTPAIQLYEKIGFVAGKADTPFVSMSLNLKSGEEHEQ